MTEEEVMARYISRAQELERDGKFKEAERYTEITLFIVMCCITSCWRHFAVCSLSSHLAAHLRLENNKNRIWLMKGGNFGPYFDFAVLSFLPLCLD